MQVVINDQEESDEERCTCEGSRGHTHGHEHAHSTPRGIAAGLIDGLELPPEVRRHAKAVYDAIALAEAKAHGCGVGDVHYHELGALDAVADITGVCYALYLLKPDFIAVSPIHVCWLRAGMVCPWPGADTRTGYGPSSGGHSVLWRPGQGRAVYPHRRCAVGALRADVWLHAFDEDKNGRIRYREKGFPGGQLRPRLLGRGR